MKRAKTAGSRQGLFRPAPEYSDTSTFFLPPPLCLISAQKRHPLFVSQVKQPPHEYPVDDGSAGGLPASVRAEPLRKGQARHERRPHECIQHVGSGLFACPPGVTDPGRTGRLRQ
ncbi:hypothetical protein HEP81_05181 [Streptomyces griseofuscus]|uniref:Uncharacterized protein n=1 Tax=Streptomyces griseofuscus TaxID=146922 RepID=A0A7H1Q560_9ACTN|nr:hypothetical protein [Streptomyces griseofuscus]QNT95440.1 hypothetical protein HEP81_05181 [Streptomyces griseofuscus]